MKILHTGDLHIGRSLLEFSLIDDQRAILERITAIALEQNADCIIIAGDVYDRAMPSEEAVSLFDEFLRRLADNHITAFIISGNHDSEERLNFGSSFFGDHGIYIASRFDGKLFRKTIDDNGQRINFYLLPFVKASQVKHFFPDAGISTYEDAVRTVIENTDIPDDEVNIIAAHQFVAGRGGEVSLSGSEGAAVQNVGLVEQIGTSCFDRFDYAAFGHIHAPQKLGRETLRYSGSPLKYSLSEINNEKSVSLVTVSGGEVTAELIPLKPMRDVRHLKGTLNQLLDAENVTDTDDYIYATLTDEEIINDAVGIFRQVYPNTVRIDYDNSHTHELERADIEGAAENRPFNELVSDFYRMVYGCDIKDEELAVLREAAEEAGVLNEAG